MLLSRALIEASGEDHENLGNDFRMTLEVISNVFPNELIEERDRESNAQQNLFGNIAINKRRQHVVPRGVMKLLSPVFPPDSVPTTQANVSTAPGKENLSFY